MSDNSFIKIILNQPSNWVHTSSNAKAEYFPRIELGEKVLVEGPKSPMKELDGTSLQVDIPCSQQSSIADITRYPLLISYLEVTPNKKHKDKDKDDKMGIISQATLDLLPYILGHHPSQETRTLTLYPVGPEGGHTTASSAATSLEEKPMSKVDVEISASLSLGDLLANGNILSLRLRSLHSLPDFWQPASSSSSYSFTACLPLPPFSSAPPNNGIIIRRGILRPPLSRDPSSFPTHWKWPGKILSPNASNAEKMESHPLEEERGVWHSKSDLSFRQSAECDLPRITWNSLHRAWLSPTDAASLLTKLSLSPQWPLEIGRFSVPPSSMGKSGKSKEVEPILSSHAVAYLDLSPLLYPGTNSVCGAFPLFPYLEAEVATKTGHALSSLLAAKGEESIKVPSMKPLSSMAKMSDIGLSDEGTREGSRRDTNYLLDSNMYVWLEIELHKPLIAKRPISVLVDRVKEFIPSRPSLPHHEGGVEQAVLNFHHQTATIAAQLIKEFRDLHLAQEKEEGEGEETEEAVDKRSKFLFHLNTSGKYYAIKEQLKRSVVKIVREKYLNRVPTDGDKIEMQRFLSELYVFLVDEMQIALKKEFSIEGSVQPVPSPLTSDLLKHFAFEAEEAGDYELAHHYHKERVSLLCEDSGAWYDYGVFCLLASLPDRCHQCLKEAVALDRTMVPALLLYGMVCCLDDDHSQAEDLFEMATATKPTHIIAWTMRGLYYEYIGKKLLQDMCFHEADKLNSGTESKTFLKLETPNLKLNTLTASRGSLHRHSNSRRLSNSSIQRTDTKDSDSMGVVNNEGVVGEDLHRDSSHSNKVKNLTAGKQGGSLDAGQPDPTPIVKRGLSEGSEVSSKEQITVSNNNGATQELKTIPRITGNSGSSIKSSLVEKRPRSGSLPKGQNSISSNPTPPSPATSIFLLAASYLLDVHALKFADMSLAHELKGGNISTSYMIAEAKLHMQRGNYQEAKAVLKKALSLDIQDSNAWAILGHAHYLTEDYVTAEDAYQRTLSLMNKPSNTHLVYTRLADVYLRMEKYAEAKDTLLHACRESPSSNTWLGVGVACYKLGDLEQAEDALSEANILNNHNPLVWAYLTMICIKTQRAVEAEQALKFAIKAGLKDGAILSEIRELHQIYAPHTDLVHLPPQSPLTHKHLPVPPLSTTSSSLSLTPTFSTSLQSPLTH